MQQNFDMQQILKLARSPAGQQLMEALKHNSSADMDKAAALASAGNMEQAKKALSGLLEAPEIKVLLQQLEEQL